MIAFTHTALLQENYSFELLTKTNKQKKTENENRIRWPLLFRVVASRIEQN